MDVDTSSYPKPAALPAQKSLLDNVQQMGGIQQQQQQIQSNALSIDKQKLDLVNQRFGEMAKSFTGLIAKPNLDFNDVQNLVQNQVKLGYVPPEMAANTLSTLPPRQPGMNDADYSNVLKDALKTHLQHAQTTMEAINTHFGTPTSATDNQNVYQGVTAPAMNGGGFKPSTQMPVQLPPTAQTVDNNTTLPSGQHNPNFQQPQMIGPAGPSGVYPASSQSKLPVAPAMSAQQPMSGPVRDPSQGNLTAAAPSFNDRFAASYPNRVPTGAAPGVAEAIQSVGSQSGKDYATDLTRAKNYQADLYPMQRVLDIVHEEGTKAFGPGTDGLNSLKSALVTWLPNVDQKTIDGVSNYEQAKKYLVQAARTAGNTGTNDQLAAAFEANPNVKMSGATIESVVKSNIALRKMQHAQTLLFGQQNLPESDYSKWISQNQNVLDPRAFGFDMMDNKARQALVASLKKDPKAYNKFENSLEFANKAGLIEPPTAK